MQHEYQANKVMNLELADSLGSAVWLHSNAASEGDHPVSLYIYMEPSSYTRILYFIPVFLLLVVVAMM